MATMASVEMERIAGVNAFIDQVCSLAGAERDAVIGNMRDKVLSKRFHSAWFGDKVSMTRESAPVQKMLAENTVTLFGPIVTEAQADFYRYFYGTEDFTTQQDFIRQMDDIDGDVEILCNCPGGNADEAAGMRQVIQRRVNDDHTVRFNILGVAASAASFVALDATESVISDLGTYMIHECSMLFAKYEWLRGREAIEYGENVISLGHCMIDTDDIVADIYVERSGMEKEEIEKMMRVETFFIGQKAVDAGFVDSVYKVEKEDKGDHDKDKGMEGDGEKVMNVREKIDVWQKNFRNAYGKNPYAIYV